MDKYMTSDDIIREFIEKVTCDQEFEMLNDVEKKAFIRNKIKEIIKDLYDLRLEKIGSLSETKTYVIRSLYGILDKGKCKRPVELKRELKINNVTGIKVNFFKKINHDIKEALTKENFARKKEYFMRSIGVSKNLFKLNLVLFNTGKDKMMNIDEYLKRTSFEMMKKDLSEVVIYIRSVEELRKVNLDNRELQIVELWFGLNPNNYRLSLTEISRKFQICKTRADALAKRALNKIRIYFSIINKEEYLNSIVCLNLSTKAFQALYRAGINTIKDLLSKSEEELMSLRGLGERNFNEIQEALSNYGKSSSEKTQDVKETNLMNEVQDLEETKRQLEERIGEIDKSILQAKNNIESLKSEVLNDRR